MSAMRAGTIESLTPHGGGTEEGRDICPDRYGAGPSSGRRPLQGAGFFRWSMRTVLLFCAFVLAAGAEIVEAQDLAARAAATSTLPLVPTRHIAFDTDEGSWISLDVSPDGRSIDFELLGDL
jgi:hypothetical protein